MKKILLGAILAIGSVAMPVLVAQASASTPCVYGGGFQAQILKGPLSAGERTGVDSEVSTQAPFTNPEGATYLGTCALSHILSVATFADGTTKVLVQNGRVPADGATRYFTKRVVVQPGFITVDPTYGPVVSVTVDTTAMCEGQPISSSTSYTVGAVEP